MKMTEEEALERLNKIREEVIEGLKSVPHGEAGTTHSMLGIDLQSWLLNDSFLMIITVTNPEKMQLLVLRSLMCGMAMQRLGVPVSELFGSREDLETHVG